MSSPAPQLGLSVTLVQPGPAPLAGDKPGRSYVALPAFWSRQAGVMIQSVGLAGGADAMTIALGHLATGRFLALYGRQGRCIAPVSDDCGRWLPAYAERSAGAAPVPPKKTILDQVGPSAILAPGFS